MPHYADPQHCPECGAELPPGAVRCDSCGLSLTGPKAARLYSTLLEADRLLDEMQKPDETTQAASNTAEGETGSGHQVSGMSTRQVPKILLTLGAACLLVAALVFLGVSWSQLGVGGRTLVLVGMTFVAGATAFWAARRRLTAALEAFGVITLGLLTLDLFGAESAGWVRDFGQSQTLVGIGAALAVCGILAALAVRRFARLPFRGGEAFTILGAVAFATGMVTWDTLPLQDGLVLALLVPVVAAQASNAFRLPVAIAGTTAVALSVWIALVWVGTDLALPTQSWPELWVHGTGWPLMVAAGVPWLTAFAQNLPLRVREILVGIGGVPLLILVAVPTGNEPPARALLIGLAVLAASALAVRTIPQPVGSGWSIPTAVGVVAGTVLLADYAGLGVERMASAAGELWGGTPGGSLPPMLIPERVPDPAFSGLLALVVAVAAWSVAGRLIRGVPQALPARPVAVFVATMAWLGAITLDAPVWSWVVGALLLAAGFTVEETRSRSRVSLAAAAGFLLAAVVVSLYSPRLGLLTATVGLLLAWTLALTDGRWMVRATASAAGTLLLADAIWAAGWWDVTAAAHPGTALVAISVIGVMLVALAGPSSHARTPAGWTPVWYGVGIAAVLAWPALAVVGMQATSVESRPAWLAAFLTAMGAAVVGAGLLSQRHRWLLLPGTTLLAAASWVRLWDLGVGTPEAYTLPWAVLLLAFGVARVVRGNGQSMRELAPGLALGLVPSLLWVLYSPLTLRGILLGVACLALVLAGSRARWSAPLVYAGAVGLIEVIRLAAPYAAQGIPRWALLGTAGVLLVVVGITWERRLAEARGAWRYLTRLR